MEIPKATAYKADKKYADEKFYWLEGFDGFFRRLKTTAPGAVIAHFGPATRYGYFVEVFASELEDAKGQPA